MPELRVVTWNSGGEAGGRGAWLAATVGTINNPPPPTPPRAPPVQIVVTQEANVGGGSIAAALTVAPFTSFAQPHGFSNEHLPPPAQPFRTTPSKGYRLSWLRAHPVAAWRLAAVGAGPRLVNLDPMNDVGVQSYLHGFAGAPFAQIHALHVAAANIRWPIYRRLRIGAGAPIQRVHFFSWHAPLLANWLTANLIHPAAFTGPALPEAFEFFQHSQFYRNIMNTLGMRDVVIVAGDLNCHRQDIQLPWMFPNFCGVTNNLTHIIAYSPSGALAVDQDEAHGSPFPPHALLAARVRW